MCESFLHSGGGFFWNRGAGRRGVRRPRGRTAPGVWSGNSEEGLLRAGDFRAGGTLAPSEDEGSEGAEPP